MGTIQFEYLWCCGIDFMDDGSTMGQATNNLSSSRVDASSLFIHYFNIVSK